MKKCANASLHVWSTFAVRPKFVSKHFIQFNSYKLSLFIAITISLPEDELNFHVSNLAIYHA